MGDVRLMTARDDVYASSTGRRSNRLMAAQLRELGRSASGDDWLAARVLRRLELDLELELLDRVLEQKTALERESSSEWSAADLENELVAWAEEELTAGPTHHSKADLPRRWLHAWRHSVWTKRDVAIGAGQHISGTCAPEARVGDTALMYVTRPTAAIVAATRFVSDPVPASADLPAHGGHFRTMNQQEVVAILEPPVALATMRDDSTLAATSAVRQNFRRSVFELSQAAWDRFVVAANLGSAEREVLDALVDHRRTFDTERELEDYLVDHLDLLAPLLGENGLRLAIVGQEGFRGRQPVLPGTDTRPDLLVVSPTGHLMVVEVKNAAADPRHVGQLASYVARIIQHLPGRSVTGLLVSTRPTLAADAAFAINPLLHHVDIDTLMGTSVLHSSALPASAESLLLEVSGLGQAVQHFLALIETAYDEEWYLDGVHLHYTAEVGHASQRYIESLASWLGRHLPGTEEE